MHMVLWVFLGVLTLGWLAVILRVLCGVRYSPNCQLRMLRVRWLVGRPKCVRAVLATVGLCIVWFVTYTPHHGAADTGSACLVGWRQTGDCDPLGPREKTHDLSCHATVRADASGYCECGPGDLAGASGCRHKAFTCNAMCSEPIGSKLHPSTPTNSRPVEWLSGELVNVSHLSISGSRGTLQGCDVHGHHLQLPATQLAAPTLYTDNGGVCIRFGVTGEAASLQKVRWVAGNQADVIKSTSCLHSLPHLATVLNATAGNLFIKVCAPSASFFAMRVSVTPLDWDQQPWTQNPPELTTALDEHNQWTVPRQSTRTWLSSTAPTHNQGHRCMDRITGRFTDYTPALSRRVMEMVRTDIPFAWLRWADGDANNAAHDGPMGERLRRAAATWETAGDNLFVVVATWYLCREGFKEKWNELVKCCHAWQKGH